MKKLLIIITTFLITAGAFAQIHVGIKKQDIPEAIPEDVKIMKNKDGEVVLWGDNINIKLLFDDNNICYRATYVSVCDCYDEWREKLFKMGFVDIGGEMIIGKDKIYLLGYVKQAGETAIMEFDYISKKDYRIILKNHNHGK